MLLGGDEIGRTQRGNNNAYCQDNEHLLVRLGPRRRAPARCASSPCRLDRAPQPPSGAPAHDVLRRRGRRTRPARHLVVPTRRAAHDARATGSTQSGPLGTFLNGDAHPIGRRARRTPCATTRCSSCSTRPRVGRRLRAAAAALRAALDVELSTAEPDAPTRRVAAREAVAGRAVERRRADPRPLTAHPLRSGLIATYRLQLRPEFTFADARRARPVPARPRASAICTSRRCCRRARDRRTATTSSTHVGCRRARRRSRSARARRGRDCRSSSTSCPNHMAASDENPFWRDPARRERFFDVDPRRAVIGASSTSTSSPACAWRTPRSSRPCTRKILELVRDGVVAGVRVDHVDGLADPAATSSDCALPASPLVWVEKILEEGERLRCVAGRGHDRLRLRSSTPTHCSSTRSAERRVRPSSPESTRRPSLELASAAKRRAGRDDVPARGRRASTPRTARGSRRRARRAPRLPHVRRPRDRARLRCRRARPRVAARARRRRPARQNSGTRRVRRAVPADDAAR